VSGDFRTSGLQREVPTEAAAVARRGANSPTGVAERRKAGRDVERSRRGCCDNCRAAVDMANGLDILGDKAESQSRRFGKVKVDDGITRLDIVALVISAVARLVISGGQWWHNMTKIVKIGHGGVQDRC
jgi:hypothetical protein